MKLNKVKTLFLDVETSPNVAYCWGKWKQDVIAFEKESEIICFAAKWADSNKIIQCRSIGGCNTEVIERIWDLLDAADIVIGHNSDAFDIRRINAEFLKYGFTPPSPYKTVDTKKVLKSNFSFNSNSLADISRNLELGEKLKHAGFSLWLGCMDDDPVSWKKMMEYNKQDVLLVEKLYKALLPWIKNHPIIPAITGVDGCPKCGSINYALNGKRYLINSVKQTARCKGCGGFFVFGVGGRIRSSVQNAT